MEYIITVVVPRALNVLSFVIGDQNWSDFNLFYLAQ